MPSNRVHAAHEYTYRMLPFLLLISIIGVLGANESIEGEGAVGPIEKSGMQMSEVREVQHMEKVQGQQMEKVQGQQMEKMQGQQMEKMQGQQMIQQIHNQQQQQQQQQYNSPPIYQYHHPGHPGPSAATDTDSTLLHADPWCTLDDPFADGALEALIADMDRKSRPTREKDMPTINEFARGHHKSRLYQFEDEDEDEEDEQYYSPFKSVRDYNCPSLEESEEYSSPYHHQQPESHLYKQHHTPSNKSRKSRKSIKARKSSKSIARLLDTLSTQPSQLNPFDYGNRKSKRSVKSVKNAISHGHGHGRGRGHANSPLVRPRASRPGSLNSVISFPSPSNQKLKPKNAKDAKRAKTTKTVKNPKKNVNGGRKK
jgi:hypothetical protein